MPEVFLAKVIWTVLGSPGLFLKAHVPRFRSEKWIGNTHRRSWCKCKKTMFRQTRAQIFLRIVCLINQSGRILLRNEIHAWAMLWFTTQIQVPAVQSTMGLFQWNKIQHKSCSYGSTDISWQESTSNASCKMYVTGKKGFPQVCQNFGPAFCREVHCLVPVLKQVWHSCILSLPLSHIAKTYGKSTTGSSFFHTVFPDASSLTLQHESFLLCWGCTIGYIMSSLSQPCVCVSGLPTALLLPDHAGCCWLTWKWSRTVLQVVPSTEPIQGYQAGLQEQGSVFSQRLCCC